MLASNESSATPRALMVVFWALVAAFAALILTVLFPDALGLFRPLFLSLMALCLLLGLALLILAVRWKQRTLLRTFWILAGAATAGSALGSVLHNAFYALGTVTGQWPVLNGAMAVLEVATFLVATFLCPLAFLAGAVGAIVLLVRPRGPSASTA